MSEGDQRKKKTRASGPSFSCGQQQELQKTFKFEWVKERSGKKEGGKEECPEERKKKGTSTFFSFVEISAGQVFDVLESLLDFEVGLR